MSKPFAWSYSSLSAFETCPWQWKLIRLTKEVQDKQYAHRATGNQIHKALEKSLMEGIPLPGEHARFAPLVERIKRGGGVVQAERKIALTLQLTETTYFGKDVWFRTAFDVRVAYPEKTVILDWKEGKRKLNDDQLKLYAAVEYRLRPTVPKVEAGYVWLNHGKLDRHEYTAEDAAQTWSEFTQRVARIEHAIKTDTFPKRPSGLCRQWCPVGKRHCEHCGE
jgi:hypothetical protein